MKAHFGLAQRDDEGLRQALGVDIRQVQAKYIDPPLHEEIPDRMIHPEWGFRMRWIEHETGGYSDYSDFPLRDADEEQAESWPLPNPDDYNYYVVAGRCRRYEPYCVVAAGADDDDVQRNVIDTLDIMMPGGGYCLAPTHMLQDNSPTENVLAVYQTASEFGSYS